MLSQHQRATACTATASPKWMLPCHPTTNRMACRLHSTTNQPWAPTAICSSISSLSHAGPMVAISLVRRVDRKPVAGQPQQWRSEEDGCCTGGHGLKRTQCCQGARAASSAHRSPAAPFPAVAPFPVGSHCCSALARSQAARRGRRRWQALAAPATCSWQPEALLRTTRAVSGVVRLLQASDVLPPPSFVTTVG